MARAINYWTHTSRNVGADFGIYVLKCAVGAAAAHVVFRRLKPSLGALTGINLLCASQPISVVFFSSLDVNNDFDWRPSCRHGLGLLAGLQLAALGWSVHRAWKQGLKTIGTFGGWSAMLGIQISGFELHTVKGDLVAENIADGIF